MAWPSRKKNLTVTLSPAARRACEPAPCRPAGAGHPLVQAHWQNRRSGAPIGAPPCCWSIVLPPERCTHWCRPIGRRHLPTPGPAIAGPVVRTHWPQPPERGTHWCRPDGRTAGAEHPLVRTHRCRPEPVAWRGRRSTAGSTPAAGPRHRASAPSRCKRGVCSSSRRGSRSSPASCNSWCNWRCCLRRRRCRMDRAASWAPGPAKPGRLAASWPLAAPLLGPFPLRAAAKLAGPSAAKARPSCVN